MDDSTTYLQELVTTLDLIIENEKANRQDEFDGGYIAALQYARVLTVEARDAELS